ncbi:holo-ACP synthase [Aliidiomarina haloalkalitolerans]|uniref:Holo-[acyl-carrier-protein] synthase n=1 Tax=Aliidiomarina haloalkalitolerans TaxID=859059 RepID=A0A432VXZ4_9GAMM|nr:holo-ACP synthase [Aliidiomarina haloalkalitolerans]RUO21552.1 holo-ACP synthase [Aliidiomarina haloalkalitolerans]
MAIIGVGTDIVEIERLRQALVRQPALAKRLLTHNEQALMQAAKQPERYLAKRFAAKEAALKALGTGLQNGLSWQHIEITNNDLGRPQLNFSGQALALADQLGVINTHLSLSDEVDYAQAFVILEGR